MEAELDELLSEDVSSVVAYERTAFDRLVEPFGKSLVLCGAGNLGRKALARLRQDGVKPLAFCDNNPALWGKLVDGVQVCSAEEAATKYGHQAAFVVAIWSPRSGHRFAQTKLRLQKLHCARVVSFIPLAWKYADTILPDNYLDLPHKMCASATDIRKVFTMWADEESRITYLSQLKWRMLADYDGLPGRTAQAQYFPESVLVLSADETFVDCGAYDGDTLREFLERTGTRFAHIVAIEPDPISFQILHTYVQGLPDALRERITLLQKAVGGREGRLRFAATGTASSVVRADGDTEIDCAPLDTILGHLVPSYIKMDIEGAEMDALAGARTTIERWRPMLAVCAYHRPDHLWRVPLLVRSLSSQHRFFLRQHDEEGWDLVCYAVPDSRLIV